MNSRFLAEVVHIVRLILIRTWSYQLEMLIALAYWLVVGPLSVIGRMSHTQFLPKLPPTSHTYWHPSILDDETANQ